MLGVSYNIPSWLISLLSFVAIYIIVNVIILVSGWLRKEGKEERKGISK